MEDTYEQKKEKVEKVIKRFPDFPKKGVNFVDYFSVSPQAFTFENSKVKLSTNKLKTI